MLNYWHRLESIDSYSLIYHAYQCSKELDTSQTSWYTSIKTLCKILNISDNDVHFCRLKFKIKIKNVLQNEYIKNWHNTRKSLLSGKLETYLKVKTNFGFENYLTIVKNVDYRKAIARLRISAHRLPIEIGRYSKVPRNERFCTKCSSNEIGDEAHFLLKCEFLHEERKEIDKYINNSNLCHADIEKKFIWVISSEDHYILNKIGQFISLYLK